MDGAKQLFSSDRKVVEKTLNKNGAGYVLAKELTKVIRYAFKLELLDEDERELPKENKGQERRLKLLLRNKCNARNYLWQYLFNECLEFSNNQWNINQTNVDKIYSDTCKTMKKRRKELESFYEKVMKCYDEDFDNGKTTGSFEDYLVDRRILKELETPEQPISKPEPVQSEQELVQPISETTHVEIEDAEPVTAEEVSKESATTEPVSPSSNTPFSRLSVIVSNAKKSPKFSDTIKRKRITQSVSPADMIAYNEWKVNELRKAHQELEIRLQRLKETRQKLYPSSQ